MRNCLLNAAQQVEQFLKQACGQLMWSVGGDLVLAASVLVTPEAEEVLQHAHLSRCFRSVLSKPSRTHYLHHFSRSEEEEELYGGEIYKLIFGFLFLTITAVITLRFYERRVYELL